MKIGSEEVIKGLGFAMGSALFYVIIPYYGLNYAQKMFPILPISPVLIQLIYVIGGAVTVTTFFSGLLPGKTVEHCVAGILSDISSATYFYIIIGEAYAGPFGVLSVKFGTTSVLVDVSLIFVVILGLILLHPITYLIELTQALRIRKQAKVTLSPTPSV